MSLRGLAFAVGLVFGLAALPAFAAQQEGGIPEGTIITPQNWQTYKDFMPDGMQALLSGQLPWKVPADFQMVVGPTHDYPVGKEYRANTEKYAGTTKIVDLPDGRHTVKGYVAGMPFPNPSEPNRGYKILVDEWYHYVPYLICGYLNSRLTDRLNNVTYNQALLVYRRLSHISDYNQPITNPQSQGIDYSEYTMLTAPEQSKYATDLTLYYDDPTRNEDVFLFIPALRRSLRLSSAARCTPWFATDWSQDEIRAGSYNGGITKFDAKVLGEQKAITMVSSPDPVLWGNWNNYYQPFYLPRPAIGKWELRDVYKLSIRRIPSLRSGYCYGNRVQYLDKQTYINGWTDLYDQNDKLWKISPYLSIAVPVPHEGMQIPTQDFIAAMWDVQNAHTTVTITNDDHGNYNRHNEECRNYKGENFDDVKKFSSTAGLSEILR
ncbi:MAG: DUF1329 domain-containing protein [Candidatus Binataceae bacterium]|nr:DUF1329 domain-containing protein [Candidatus Binataceae bacterium]